MSRSFSPPSRLRCTILAALCALSATWLIPASGAESRFAESPELPWIFAHRGASGERPEHTMSAYRLALEQGADFIEPDLRISKDGVFIALHDATLNRTTDIAAHTEFADRAKVDKAGNPIWFPADFTLAELRTLKCRQGTGRRSKQYDGAETIPTLAEIVTLVRAWNREHSTKVGIVPELRGNAEAFIAFVKEHQLGVRGDLPVYLQSFEAGTLRTVREALGFPAALLTQARPELEKMQEFRGVFDAIAVGRAGCLNKDSKEWITAVHALGMRVIAWTFDDAAFDKTRFTSSTEEMVEAFRNGVDAVFTDHPSSAIKARAILRTAAPTEKPQPPSPR